jgi:hypothetical protein
MIFQFPSLETFRLAVTSAQVPPEVSAAPAEVAFDPEGRPSVRSAVGIPPKVMQTALRKMGVKQSKEHYAEAILTVDCWPQILPVAKVAAIPEVTSNTAVLFDMPLAELSTVVTEMLRLGNDRQSFRTVATADGTGERALLKVIGPPYYTLLRAIDKSTQKGATIAAYVEKAPRVWVEVGYEHPLAGQIKPAAGQVLLLRPEREWAVIADAPFQDVYEILDFKLPAASVDWQESQLKGRLSVPLRLVAGNAADVAELWVLTEDAVDQLDALVRDADERLMSRMSFAVAQENGKTTIVLKTRPSKLSPPVLSLAKAQAFKPFWKLPNLFLPVSKRLMPTLRRDAVRRLLADDPAQVVWLMPQSEGKFNPEVLPDDAFRPLEDWIDYVIDHEHQALEAWVQATRFDFDSFVCREEQPDKPKAPPGEKGKRSRKGDRSAITEEDAPTQSAVGDKRKPSASVNEVDFGVPVEAMAPSEVKVKLRELESQFLEDTGSLDSPERRALWVDLARYNTLDNRESEATICWANAFWDLPEIPASASWEWLQTEDRRSRRQATAEEFDSAIEQRNQSPHAARTFAVRVIHVCSLPSIPNWFATRVPAIREHLERNENILSVRTVWLAWWHLARCGGQADVLALARARDRLLQRLLNEGGLNKERDLPYFLRAAGDQDSDRMRLVRDRAMKVHKLVDQWQAELKVNKPYVELMFAFGLAKLGEATAARDLMRSALERLLEPITATGRPDLAHEFLGKCFVWRIENALQGKPHAGPLPAEMMERLETIDEHRGTTLGWRYIIDRLRESSWILEPRDRIVAYARWQKKSDDFGKTLQELANAKDSRRLEEQLKTLIGSKLSAENRLLLFCEAAILAPRVGEDFSVTVLQQVPAVLDAASKVAGPSEHLATLRGEQRKLLERSLFLAAHYDRPALVQLLFDKFLTLLNDQEESERYLSLRHLARECLRSLRKLGLKDEIDRFLKQSTELVVQGRSFAQLRNGTGHRWADVLMSLLSIAEGWLYFGGLAQAKPFLDEAAESIFSNGRMPKDKRIGHQDFAKLVQAYISAIGQGPVDEALNRIDELFQKIDKLPNGFTTQTHFSRLHLEIVEDVVRSLISDNIALGDQARRWLDDDEYLVRRRIHSDMRSVLSQSGL